jgi:hypothetical protein
MFDFDKFLNTLREDLKSVVKEHAEGFGREVTSDSIDFASKMKNDIERWAGQLARGELEREDFEWLLAAKKDLAEMQALKMKGLAQVRIDRIRNAVVQTIAGSALKAAGIG